MHNHLPVIGHLPSSGALSRVGYMFGILAAASVAAAGIGSGQMFSYECTHKKGLFDLDVTVVAPAMNGLPKCPK